YYYGWWLEPDHACNLLLAPLLLLAVIYNVVQVFAAWYIYARIKTPPARFARPGLRVDVFVPVYDEDEGLVATSLAAAVNVTYPHRTFLLDDAHKDSFRELARLLGAHYVRRSD